MTVITRRGEHRKTREIPWAYIATGFTLFALAVALLTAVSWLATPTYAHAATRPTPSGSTDPFWDGKHPSVWTSYREPKCSDLLANHLATVRFPDGYQSYLECRPLDGTQVYVWQLVTAVHAAPAAHRLTWADVLRRCNRTCLRVPASVRKAEGIKPGQPALILYGNTTYIWVKEGQGVRTITS